MGFAGVLSEIGLPRSEFVPALRTFNVGVELGQLTVIFIAFLLVVRRGLPPLPGREWLKRVFPVAAPLRGLPPATLWLPLRGNESQTNAKPILECGSRSCRFRMPLAARGIVGGNCRFLRKRCGCGRPDTAVLDRMILIWRTVNGLAGSVMDSPSP
jgi:hypothetical protein